MLRIQVKLQLLHPNGESRNKAMEMVKNIVAKPEMGKVYKGKVIKIMEFGALLIFWETRWSSTYLSTSV